MRAKYSTSPPLSEETNPNCCVTGSPRTAESFRGCDLVILPSPDSGSRQAACTTARRVSQVTIRHDALEITLLLGKMCRPLQSLAIQHPVGNAYSPALCMCVGTITIRSVLLCQWLIFPVMRLYPKSRYCPEPESVVPCICIWTPRADDLQIVNISP